MQPVQVVKIFNPFLPTHDLGRWLLEMLEFTIRHKLCQWIKDADMNGVTWDVVLIVVRTVQAVDWTNLGRQEGIV